MYSSPRLTKGAGTSGACSVTSRKPAIASAMRPSFCAASAAAIRWLVSGERVCHANKSEQMSADIVSAPSAFLRFHDIEELAGGNMLEALPDSGRPYDLNRRFGG